MRTIGYLVPEFPSQTHMFFWREIQALAARGVRAELVSTRPPAARIISHRWAAEAMSGTEYLAPSTGKMLGHAAAELTRFRPAGWLRCCKSIARAEGIGVTGRLRLLGLAILGGQLAAFANKRGWTHVHVHSCADSAHIALFASLLSGPSYSLTLHGPLGDYGPNQREKWGHASFAVVITKRLFDEVRDGLAGHLPARIEIAPMGVDLDGLRRSGPYRPWRGEGTLRIFSCGRLNPGKGHADLIAAVALVRAGGLDVRLVIAGEDEGGGTGYRRVAEGLIAEMDAREIVTLLGAVDEAIVRRELEAAHIFGLASLEEPLGVAIMEAMAMRVPVVATNAGGVPELVDDGVDGLLVPPRDVAALADALRALALDPERALAMGAAGRAKVEASFGSGRSAAVLAGLLRPHR